MKEEILGWNLKVNEDDSEGLEPIVVTNPWLKSISQIQTG